VYENSLITYSCVAIYFLSSLATEPGRISFLLSLHGLASEEYLCFCDDATLDELSSGLKTVPRRMFEYFRSNLWQPYKNGNCTVHSSESLETSDCQSPDINGQVADLSRISLDKLYDPGPCHGVNNFEPLTSGEKSDVYQGAELSVFDISRESNPSTGSTQNTTSKSHSVEFGGKLSLFFSDSRVARCEFIVQACNNLF